MYETSKSWLVRAAPWLALFAFASASRLAYLPELAQWPDFALPAVDAAYHDYWARGIVSGEWPLPGGQIVAENPRIHETPFFRPPGYPYFLALIHATVGDDPTRVRLVQFLLGALTCTLTGWLGARVLGRPVGIVAGTLAAGAWTSVFFDGELQPPVLATALSLGGLLAVLEADRTDRSGWAVVGGTSCGLAILTVPNVAAGAAFAAGWLARPGWQRRRGHVLAFVLALLAAIAPATVRNARVSGEFVPISTNLGINLWAGNNPASTGHDVDVPGFGTSFDHREMVRRASAEAGHELSDAGASRHYADKALAYVVDEPLAAIVRTGRKALMFWAAREIASNKELNFAREESRVLALLPVGFAGLAALAAVGVWFGLRSRPEIRRPTWLLTGWIVAQFLGYLPFFVTGRYRVPLIPPLALLAGLGVVGIVASVRARAFKPAATALLAAVFLRALLQIDIARPANAADWHHLQGVTLARGGHPDEAIARFDLAVAADPDHVSSLHERAKLHLAAGRVEPALADLREGHRRAPSSIPVALDLGGVLRRMGRPQDAVAVFEATLATGSDAPMLRSNLGLALMAIGDLEAAEDAFEGALALYPEFTPALINLGIVSAQQGRLDAATRHFRRAVELEPNNQSARTNLELALSLGSAQPPAAAGDGP